MTSDLSFPNPAVHSVEHFQTLLDCAVGSATDSSNSYDWIHTTTSPMSNSQQQPSPLPNTSALSYILIKRPLCLLSGV